MQNNSAADLMFPLPGQASKALLKDRSANSLADGEDGSVDIDADVDVDQVLAPQKPHFLDYDAVPPPEFEQSFERILSFSGCGSPVADPQPCEGERLKLDKKYERDGEISDFELAASGYTKKEFTQDDNTLHLPPGGGLENSGGGVAASGNALRKGIFAKPKHFLDENPIPPDYMLKQELREHRSLDRNFERHSSAPLGGERSESPHASSGDGRNVSLDRSSSGASGPGGVRSSRERLKEPSYTLSRFLDSDPKQMSCVGGAAGLSSPASLPPLMHSMSSAAAWTDSFDSRYGSLQFPGATGSGTIFPEVVDTLGPKVECVYSLLSMLGSNDPLEMAKKFLELSRTPETCATLRRSGCIPLLVQMMHSAEGDDMVRKWAGMALHNVVHSHPDEKAGRREAKVLRLLDQIIDYCNFLKTLLQSGGEAIADDSDRHPLAAISSLMKVSFDEEHRHAMCELGALQAIPNLVHLDHAVHGPKPEDQCCNSLRRYALMALTNLTFGDENNKALLCSQKVFMEALVAQLDCAPDDLLQVTASVLRNLSWRADVNMKAVLNEIGTVTALARAAMKNKCENTLKAILSALWNLSAHCSTNKAEFCAVDGALAFLVQMLTYEGPSKTLKIIENAGGILRNVSSHIAVREHYRQILREHNCLAILLQQLKSESLTVVSNSCGTLWNLSARCPEDQKFLWDNGAVPMLRSLIHSKHAMISEGSSSALKNLLNFRPSVQNQNPLDPIARSMGLKKLPTLNARKQKALEQELDEKEHSETCDNLDVIGSRRTKERSAPHRAPGSHYEAQLARRCYPLAGGSSIAAGGSGPPGGPPAVARLTRSAMLTKSESRDSIFSAKSDSVYENLMLRSHSASDATRGGKSPAPGRSGAAAPPAFACPLDDNEVEASEEQPIDYSIKYNERSSSKRRGSQTKASLERIDLQRDATSPAAAGSAANGFTVYQETDLDQPTDFSLRYAENQIESDADISPPDAELDAKVAAAGVADRQAVGPAVAAQGAAGKGSEIMLILEDSVKCYQTEDTPYVISNAASVTDLRQSSGNSVKATKAESMPLAKSAKCPDSAEPLANAAIKGKYQAARSLHTHPGSGGAPAAIAYGSGSYTPEKPINYCEEGTPGYFSRYESLSSLDESPPSVAATKAERGEEPRGDLGVSGKAPLGEGDRRGEEKTTAEGEQPRSHTPPPKDLAGPQSNSAQETPLMFSRHSSMDSLVEEDVGPCDDKSSVISDFSRLASGVISPSELPDSPTQSMPQSPRRNSGSVFSAGMSPVTPRGAAMRQAADGKRPPTLRSVFEDETSAFNVENTPAQFSTATSLSNLSIIEDEHNSPPSADPSNDAAKGDAASPAGRLNPHPPLSEGEEEEEEEEVGVATNDDLLLASCINMGMQRPHAASATGAPNGQPEAFHKQRKQPRAANEDEPQHYYTEDTPALLSKVGSNSNLSAISMCSSNGEPKPSQAPQGPRSERLSLNLSDVESSNASESGAGPAAGPSLLEQCIRDGMKKPQQHKTPPQPPLQQQHQVKHDPIEMMRRGGNSLPPYLPVSDEMSRYLVEDSPCNFSVVSGLSNLTVGSSIVGPAVQLKESRSVGDGHHEECPAPKGQVPAAAAPPVLPAPPPLLPQEDVRRQHAADWQDDSLSSLSIDSEDDTNLLSQAIAAGCNRPKSNLGFSTMSSVTSKRSSSLSASQPIPINSAASASSLNAASTSRRQHTHHNQPHHGDKQRHHSSQHNGNESSFSSVDSSDSNDNQSKSLFELCIVTGMQKSSANRESRKPHMQTTHHSMQLQLQHQLQHNSQLMTLNANVTQSNPNLKHAQAVAGNRHVRERERKDERLLQECINTGITKKLGRSGPHSLGVADVPDVNVNVAVAPPPPPARGPMSLPTPAVSVPKNGQATSAAASEQCRPTAATTSPSVPSTAAPGVESTINTTTNNKAHSQQHITNNISSNNTNNSNTTNSNTNSNTTSNSSSITSSRSRPPANSTTAASPRDAITDTAAPRNPPPSRPERRDDDPPSPATEAAETRSDTGCNPEAGLEIGEATLSCNNSLSLDNTTSDESNQSFIMETTVSLEVAGPQPRQQDAKHKDPDLMLKSVERLTMEFVSSAEQLRTHNSTGGDSGAEAAPASGRRLGSFSLGVTSNSNNTWNEDTCPNDVSFPSVSVTAPVVASLLTDDSRGDEDDDDEVDYDEQATEADHRELHDFAEITPTNEEQPPPASLVMGYGVGGGGTQPNSLGTETETDTLVAPAPATRSHSGSSGINFQLGGEVQSAAVAVAASRNLFYSTSSSMTNSTIIAIEARALADNLQCQPPSSTSTDPDELTFSLNSLDLDNVRPPSGMDSLNMSGYFQADAMQGSATQPNSLQRLGGPLMGSPKFPRKTLPAGFVAKRALGQLPGPLAGSTDSVASSCNLLDNIKPPSLMDELLDSMISVASIQSEVADCESMATTMTGSGISNYETAAGCNEFDDNTVTLQSCCDNMLPRDDAGEDDDDEEDLTAKSSTPLPSDGDFSSAETTPKKSSAHGGGGSGGVRRTLTPKQKRKMAKDRFKTYTIAADFVLGGAVTVEADETLQIEIIEQEQDRYRTQTIECPPAADQLPATDLFTSFVISSDANGPASMASTDECVSEDMSSIRAMTKQFKFISGPAPEPVPQREPEEEYCDQNSETESCHEQQRHGDESDEEAGEAKRLSGKPKIVKPSEEDENDEAESSGQSPKAVRGRKKAAYVSPYSMQYQRNTALVTRLATNKLITATGPGPAGLRKRTTTQNNGPTSPQAGSKLAQKKKTTEVVGQSPPPKAPPPLERQGTFVKDEPTNGCGEVPVVEAHVESSKPPVTTTTTPTANAKSPQSSPSHKRSSKLPMKQQQQGSASKAVGGGFTRKPPIGGTTVVGAAVRRVVSQQMVATAQRSNSNASIRVTTNTSRVTRVSATTPPSRSNSNVNTAAAANSAASAATKIHQAQSRIASMWKRVDEAKKAGNVAPKGKQQEAAPAAARVSNLKRPPLGAVKAANVKQQPAAVPQKPATLIRSSTFDNTPPPPEVTGGMPVITAGCNGNETKSKIALTRTIAGGNRHISAKK